MRYIFTFVLALLAYSGFSQDSADGYVYDKPPAKIRNISCNIGGTFISADDTAKHNGIRSGVNYGLRYQGGRELHKGMTILVGGELQYAISTNNTFKRRNLEYVYVGVPVSFDYETFAKHQGYYVKATLSAGFAHQDYFNMHTYAEFDGGLLFAADRCRIGIGPYLQYSDDLKSVENDNVKNVTTVGIRLSLNLR